MRRLALATSLVFVACLSAAAPGIAWGQGLEAEIKDMTWVGFQQFEEASRVFVRTSEKVRYRVDTSRDGMVVLILENTRVPVFNNTRPLDTRSFESPVRRIEAKPIEGPSPSVHVEIRLRRKVPFDIAQADTIVALDFTRQ